MTQRLLYLWEQHGRPHLAGLRDCNAVVGKHRKGLEKHNDQAQFITKAGQAFTQTSMCDWWKALHSSSGAVWPFITLHTVRHVMVAVVMAHPGLVNHEAAAMLMGTSTRQWAASYDKGKGGRLLAQGQADMPAFGHAMLAPAMPRAAGLPAHEVGVLVPPPRKKPRHAS